MKVFCLGLLSVVCLTSGPVQTAPDVPAVNADHLNLAPAATTKRELTAGAKDTFGIYLNSGDFLQLTIEKGDFALALTIYDSAQTKLLEQISYGFEVLEVSIPAESTGRHLLEIRSLELNDSRRQYELKPAPLRPTTAVDRRRDMARRAIASATILRDAWTENALRQSIDKYDEATLISRSLHDSRDAAIATMKAAEVCVTLGQYREALTRFQKAAVLSKNAGARLEEAKARSEMGRLFSYLGDNDRAQKHLVEAAKLLTFDSRASQPLAVKITHAETLLNSGEVSYSKGNLVRSSQQFEEALKLFNEVGDRTGSARAHLFLGYIKGSLGDPEAAVAEVSRALDLYRATKNKSGEGLCLTVLGIAQSVGRKEAEAMKLHREAIEIFRTIGDRQSEAIAVNGLGQAYEFLGEYPTALQFYGEVLQLFENTGSLDFAASSSLNLARIYQLMGDREKALEYYDKCLRLSRSTRKVRSEANALNGVALLYSEQGAHAKAISQYHKILRFYESISDRRGQATAWNNLGDVYFLSGEKQQALASYERALALSEQAKDNVVLISSLYNIAREQSDRGNLKLALASIERSLTVIEDLRTNVASSGFRISYFSGVRKHYDLCIDLLMQLHKEHPDQGFDTAALRTSERARARSLLDILTEVRGDIRPGVAPEMLARERHLRGLLRAQAAYQMDLSVSGADRSEKDEVARQMNQLRADYQEIEAQLKDPSSHLDQWNSLSLEQVQAELGDGHTILLEYALGDERSYLWAVTANSLHSYELPPRSTLENAGREVYNLLTARQQVGEKMDGDYQTNVEKADRDYPDKVRKLSQLLLGPVADQLGTKRIIIVTEGMLQYIPHDALPLPRSQRVISDGNVLGEDRPLVETNEVVMLPSISTLAAIRKQTTKVSGQKTVAIFADPVFNTNDDRVQHKRASLDITASDSDRYSGELALRSIAGGGGPRRLVHSSEEANAILATIPRSTALLVKAFDANRETAMRPDVGDYQIVHFATHGYFNSEHPELSGIILAMVKPDGSKINGFMALPDIYKLKLSAQLVVVSACDTALGKDIKGEGLVSLTRGFMHAGSRSVVTSLWKVDDRATATLMKHFYEFMLRDGMTPAAALRAAKQKIRKEKAFSAPFFWAGFTLQGEYREQIVTSSAPSPSVLVALVALVLTSAGIIILQRRWRVRLLHKKV